MKVKVKEILSIAKGVKPSYFIQYTVMDGEIVITDANKRYDGSPNLIYGDVMADDQIKKLLPNTRKTV